MSKIQEKANLERMALVKRLLNENKEILPDEKVLMSKASIRTAQAVINALTCRYGTEKAIYHPVLMDDSIAHTNGRTIVVNIGGDYFHRCSSLQEKRKVEQGLYTHEAGHILFTDFKTLQDFLKAWEKKRRITFL